MKNIAIFWGGKSVEHDVSIITGIQCYHTLIDSKKYNIIPVYVDKENNFYTGENITHLKNYKNKSLLINKSKKLSISRVDGKVLLYEKNIFKTKKILIECAVLAFHGGLGENGSFQGLFETIGLPYTGSEVLGSALCLDKGMMKNILSKTTIPLSKYLYINKNEYEVNKISNMCKNMKYPLFVKPSNGGSSIAVNIARDGDSLMSAVEIAFSFDNKIIIEEEFNHDMEINISCFGYYDEEVKTSLLEQVFTESDFLDFENKYLKGGKSKKGIKNGMASTNRVIPANIPKELEEKIKNDAVIAFKALQCGGVARVDFLVNSKTQEYVLVEVNTIPGSLSYYLWNNDTDFLELLEKLIEKAIVRHSNRNVYNRNFNSRLFN